MTITHPYVDADRYRGRDSRSACSRWELYGAGMENLGQDDAPLLRAVPRPGPGELLVRVDACGICFSDIKIINLGGSHPRLQGRDMRGRSRGDGSRGLGHRCGRGARRARSVPPGQRRDHSGRHLFGRRQPGVWLPARPAGTARTRSSARRS